MRKSDLDYVNVWYDLKGLELVLISNIDNKEIFKITGIETALKPQIFKLFASNLIVLNFFTILNLSFETNYEEKTVDFSKIKEKFLVNFFQEFLVKKLSDK